MMILVSYYAVTDKGRLDGEAIRDITRLETKDDVELVREHIQEQIEREDGIKLLGSGKIIINNIIKFPIV